MKRVAIIDDEIHTGLLKHRNRLIEKHVIENNTLKKISLNEDTLKLSHSTICAQILEHYAQVEYELINIKLLREKTDDIQTKDIGQAEAKQLKLALEKCAALKVDIISMSLGSTILNDARVLDNTIEQLNEMGVIMVGAGSNIGHFSVPAMYPEVIGVQHDGIHILKRGEMIYDPCNVLGIEVTAGFGFKRYIACNSFTVPIVVARILKYMDQGLRHKNEIVERLIRESPKRILKIFQQSTCNDIVDIDTDLDIPHLCIVQDKEDDSFITVLMECFERENQHCALIEKEANKYSIGIFETKKYNISVKNLLAFVSTHASLDAIFTSWKEEDYHSIKNELGAAPDVLIYVDGENIFAENDEGIAIYDTARQGNISRQEFGKLLVSFMVTDT